MDDIFSKIKRKLIPQTVEVISPAEKEQRMREMLGYAPIENTDTEFYIPRNTTVMEKDKEIDRTMDEQLEAPEADENGIYKPIAIYKDKKSLTKKALDSIKKSDKPKF